MQFNFKLRFIDTVHYHQYMNVVKVYSDILQISITNMLIIHIVIIFKTKYCLRGV